MWLHINFIECLCPYISTGFNNIACKSLYFVATWKHIEKASSLEGCLVPSTIICRHQVQGTPMLSSSLCIWQTAHGPQHANAQKSLQAEPWMPPRVLILVLITTVPPGTKKGIQQHSPVLVATLQTVQGRQKYPRIHDLMSVKQSNSPVVQFLWPSIVETIRGFPVPPAVGCWTITVVAMSKCIYLLTSFNNQGLLEIKQKD